MKGKIYISTILEADFKTNIIEEVIKKADFEIGLEYFSFDMTIESQKKLREIRRKFPNANSTFHSPMIDMESTSKKGTEDYKKLISNWRKTLKITQEFKSSHIVFHSNNCFINAEERKERQNNCVLNTIYLDKLCKEHGIELLVETLGIPEKGLPLFSEDEFIEFVNKHDLSVIVDIGHMNLNNYNYVNVLKNIGKNVKAYHLHNNDGKNDTHNRINDGTFDLNVFASCYKKYTPHANLVIEYIEIPGLTADLLLEDLKLLKKITK